MEDLIDLLTYQCPVTKTWRCAVSDSDLAKQGYKMLGCDDCVDAEGLN